jgi:hypothetical protein
VRVRTDLNVYLIGVVVVLLLMLFGLLKNDIEWAVFPAMATIIGLYLTIAVGSDGSLTQVSGGSTVAIVSASGTGTGAWTFVFLIPMLFAISSGLVTIYKVGKSF